MFGVKKLHQSMSCFIYVCLTGLAPLCVGGNCGIGREGLVIDEIKINIHYHTKLGA